MFLPILHLFNDGYLAAMPLILPFASTEFNLSLGVVGLLGSLLSFSGIVLALPAGIVASRFGTLKILSLAVLFYSLGFIILGFSNGILMVTLAFLLSSIAFGFFHPVAFSSVAKLSDSNSLGKSMGIFAATGDIGKIAFAAAVTFIIGITSWRITSFLYGIVAFILFSITFFFTKKEQVRVKGERKSKVNIDYSILKNKSFNLSNMASALDSFANASLFIFIPFLLSFRGIDSSFIGSFTSIFFIGNLLGKVVMGRMVDKIGQERLFIISEVLIFISLLALSLVPYTFAILFLALALGFFTKGTVPITSTMIAQSVDKNEYESAYSINSLSTSISNTIAPMFFGFIADILGVQMIFLFCGVFALVSIVPASMIIKLNKRKDPIKRS